MNSLCKIHDALKHQVWNWIHSQVWLLPKGYQKCCFWFSWNSVELLILLSTNTDGHSQINFHVVEESLSSVTKIGTCKKLWLKTLTNYMDSAGIKPVLQPVNTEILKNAWMPQNACLPGVYIVFRAAILLLVQFFFTSGALSWKAGTAMSWHFLAKYVLLKSSWSAVVSRARLHNWHYLKLWTNFHQSGKQGRGPKKISGFP